MVDFSDLDRLQEGEFLNDNLINFFIKWVFFYSPDATKLTIARYYEVDFKARSSDYDRMLFFNTYFYGTMARRPDK